MKCVHFAIHCKIVGHYSFVILVQIFFFPFPSENLHSFSPVYFIGTIRTIRLSFMKYRKGKKVVSFRNVTLGFKELHQEFLACKKLKRKLGR